MTDQQPLPVKGYQPQSAENIALVNSNKEMEERLLRRVEELDLRARGIRSDGTTEFDSRWTAIARTHFEQGFMALNRAIFQPARTSLPEDHAATQV